ncbi:orotidine-5'-phosphate decarboxylase [Clostridium botulinum]|uniref:Orotidine 5'-phosphate decarboxylase n=1 Tax=Clostridium botulinum C/D str. DC5 TaxID=1443128 RepID=A0A0A0IFQ6_CLOBO|nr:orotidine-5'-phosphate decarboxylase [Clostridium botulinum]KEI01725.1 orotidine 5'-phosphate decarboxylase [Clostridium botulinum C/D str. BKT75002]KEI07459.1 orotidine 5'-phosphate decarboxylase [Clostridium botulinum C/D str. BKT2873]KGM93251.1 orotidine 5'-phosphate decarboxylase [Clostridium botulinum D str. CCUG 7971]KGM99812.1 orotidine 5'-phosphate decarboxylase [Clostridium botulinum C/D str. DC5]KOC49376.1 orotidine 5'-phosphate decarboxylase [Clostridium botulinum]
MIIDRLYEEVQKKGNVCVGLDTDLSYIPEWFLKKYEDIDYALFNFNKKIIDATYDKVACYKVQIAYYEAYGIKGLMAYKKTLEYIRKIGCLAISDVKRGDIAKTAEMYAKAHFEGDFESDFMTVNPYMGMDSIEPYMPYMKNKEKGLFVLIRTSNPGSKDFEYIQSSAGRRVYEAVGEKIESLSKSVMGKYGYSSIGGVVGCTTLEDGKEIRKRFNKTFFLIPGFGAQGGGAKEARVYLKDGNGGVVNSSRGILLAYRKYENGEKNFDECSRKEVIKMQKELWGE